MPPHHKKSPPEWALRLLRGFCDPLLIEDVEGDLHELYRARLETGAGYSRWWFILQVLLLFRPGIIRPLFSTSITQTTMVNHYFTTAFRHARRYKGHTLLNVFGLILGISSALLLLLYVQSEISMDSFHENSPRIVKIWRNMYQSSGTINTTPAIPQPLKVVLDEEYPQVDRVTLMSWAAEFPVRHEDHTSFYQGHYVSEEFFDVFTFPLIRGNKASVFDKMQSVVITDELAKILFGDDWDSEALGEQIILGSELVEVTGIVKSPGSRSSIQFDLLLPAKTFIAQNDWVEDWGNGGFRMFMTLRDPGELAVVRHMVENEVNDHTESSNDEQIVLQPFSESYLYGTFEQGEVVGGRIQYVRILAVTAFFLLLIATINYVNLTTARSTRRAREVGLRKVFGARRFSMSSQFFTESFLMVFISIMVSVGLVYIVLPYFSQLAGRTLYFDWTDIQTWIGLVGLIGVLTLFSGMYPALVLPSFGIIPSLRNSVIRGVGNISVRKMLVVFQFALSMLLIIGMLVVSDQMHYILTKNLGVEKEDRISINLEYMSPENRQIFRDQAREYSDIASITLSSSNPLFSGWSTGGAEWEGKEPDEVAEMNVMNVDQFFFETMGISFESGRGFSSVYASDSNNYVINETAAELMGYSEPVGSPLTVWGISGSIIGVVKDFHMSNLYDPMSPLIIRYDPGETYVALAHLTNAGGGLTRLKELSKQLDEEMPFQYEFLDQDFASDYQSEQRISTLMKLFAVLSILIASLGLLGLISYSNEQRRKEIGIRKVMGASASGLTFQLSREYILLIFISFVVACPAAWYISQDWLNSFAFHVDLSGSVFLVAAALLIIVALTTTGIKSFLAARMNPVDSIRDD